jgi:hypothetical protein
MPRLAQIIEFAATKSSLAIKPATGQRPLANPQGNLSHSSGLLVQAIAKVRPNEGEVRYAERGRTKVRLGTRCMSVCSD